MINRYDVNANGTDSFWVESELEKEGEWCKWEDVQRLEKENATLVKLVKEMCDYLDNNKLNQICSSSIFHTMMQDKLTAAQGSK